MRIIIARQKFLLFLMFLGTKVDVKAPKLTLKYTTSHIMASRLYDKIYTSDYILFSNLHLNITLSNTDKRLQYRF